MASTLDGVALSYDPNKVASLFIMIFVMYIPLFGIVRILNKYSKMQMWRNDKFINDTFFFFLFLSRNISYRKIYFVNRNWIF